VGGSRSRAFADLSGSLRDVKTPRGLRYRSFHACDRFRFTHENHGIKATGRRAKFPAPATILSLMTSCRTP
jgi:hypothetical protein